MPLLKRQTSYLTKSGVEDHQPGWFRERLVVFVPTSGKQLSEPVVAAIEQVVSVSEAPLLGEESRKYCPMTSFIHFAPPVGNDDARSLITRRIKDYADTENLNITPSIRTLNSSEGSAPGVFLGTAVFAPREGAVARGRIRLEIREEQRRDSGPALVTAEVVFGHSLSEPAAFYPQQDRVVFGQSHRLPAWLKFDTDRANRSLNEAQDVSNKILKKDLVFMLLPQGATSPDPRLYVAVTDPMAMSALGQHASEAKQSGDHKDAMWSVLRGGKDADQSYGGGGIELLSLRFDDETGACTVDLGDQYTKPDSGQKHHAKLVIEPNQDFSRLRHSPEKVKASYFSIVSLLLPAPASHSQIEEVAVNLRADGQFIGHGLDHLYRTLLIRPSLMAQLQLAGNDEATIADVHGALAAVSLGNDDEIGDDFRLTRASGAAASIFAVANALASNFDGGLQKMLRQSNYYALSLSDEMRRMGYIGCPTSYELAEDELDGSDARPSPITLSRAKETYGLCLDWLDECVRIAVKHRHGPVRDMGYAEFLSKHRMDMCPLPLRPKQRLELQKVQNSQLRRLSLIEEVDDQSYLRTMVDGGLYQVGPLICRYHFAAEPL